MSETPLVETRRLTKVFDPPPDIFHPAKEPIRAIEDLSLKIEPGEVLGVIGEPGSGKSVLGRLLIHLIQPSSGQVLFDGQDVQTLNRDGQHDLRRQTQIVFQHPYSAFDPHYTIYKSLTESLVTHTDLHGEALDRRVLQLLNMVGLRPELLGQYPRALTGPQLQRVAIARAMALGPRFLVFDDPLCELEPLAQVQILNLLCGLRNKHGFTALFSSRRPVLAQKISDRLAVLYQGRLVELAPASVIAQGQALHPYTQALQASPPSSPDPDRQLELQSGQEFPTALVPDSFHGCSYYARCPLAETICTYRQPPLVEVEAGHWVACHLAGQPPVVK